MSLCRHFWCAIADEYYASLLIYILFVYKVIISNFFFYKKYFGQVCIINSQQRALSFRKRDYFTGFMIVRMQKWRIYMKIRASAMSHPRNLWDRCALAQTFNTDKANFNACYKIHFFFCIYSFKAHLKFKQIYSYILGICFFLSCKNEYKPRKKS